MPYSQPTFQGPKTVYKTAKPPVQATNAGALDIEKLKTPEELQNDRAMRYGVTNDKSKPVSFGSVNNSWQNNLNPKLLPGQTELNAFGEQFTVPNQFGQAATYQEAANPGTWSLQDLFTNDNQRRNQEAQDGTANKFESHDVLKDRLAKETATFEKDYAEKIAYDKQMEEQTALEAEMQQLQKPQMLSELLSVTGENLNSNSSLAQRQARLQQVRTRMDELTKQTSLASKNLKNQSYGQGVNKFFDILSAYRPTTSNLQIKETVVN